MANSSKKAPANYAPPNTDEFEVSLFGPGYGECLVVHYGNGRCFTVDSCLESDLKTPTPLAYFNRLGIDPAECVTHNIVTHPDGDHNGGISKLFRACRAARLVCPVTLADREMVVYCTFYNQTDPTPLARTSRELYDLLELSAERGPNSRLYVKQDTLIIGEAGVRLTALAPSDQKVNKFLARIAQQKPKPKTDRRAPGRLLPNDVSAALLLEVEGLAAVLGADLEETPGGGWSTVLEASIAFNNAVPPGAFKVAHHGSINADCPRLWDRMNDPVAILAPFKLGSNKLPNPSDVDRILAQTKRAYSTSSFKTQPVKRLSRTDNILIQHGIRRRKLYPKNGHIRVRVDATSSIKLDLFESAVHLSQIH